MNDRYLFRGKRIDNGEWAEGYYTLSIANKRHTNPKYQQALIWVENDGLYNIEVDPTTVGQCTGLKDKRGKLIFDGDIVQICDNPPTIVFWHSSNASWAVISIGMYPKRNSGEVRSNGVPLCQDIKFGCKIIGNKWDNPELLEA